MNNKNNLHNDRGDYEDIELYTTADGVRREYKIESSNKINKNIIYIIIIIIILLIIILI
jgi:hypothetical protein